MNQSRSRNRHRWCSRLELALFVVVAVLTAKAVLDVFHLGHRHFPAWFPPAFAVGTATLLLFAGAVVLLTMRTGLSAPVSKRTEITVWTLIPVSFVCTTAVHGFAPFRFVPLSAYSQLNPVLAFNFALAAAGFFVVIGLAALFFSGRRAAAEFGLLLVGFALLVPNDNCGNPFNWWWIRQIGASPLMFVPNLFVFLFALGALRGVWTRMNVLAILVTCLLVTVLGIGHMTRLLW